MSAVITMQNAIDKAFISSSGEGEYFKLADTTISPKDTTHDVQARNLPFSLRPDNIPEFVMSKSNTHPEHFESPVRHAIVFTEIPDGIVTG